MQVPNGIHIVGLVMHSTLRARSMMLICVSSMSLEDAVIWISLP